MQQAMEDPCEDAHDGEDELEAEAGEEVGHDAEEGPEVVAGEEGVHVDEAEQAGPDQLPAPVSSERRRQSPPSRQLQSENRRGPGAEPGKVHHRWEKEEV